MAETDRGWKAVYILRYPLLGAWILMFAAWVIVEFVFDWDSWSRILETASFLLVIAMFTVMGWLRGYARGQMFQNKIVAGMLPERGLYRDSDS